MNNSELLTYKVKTDSHLAKQVKTTNFSLIRDRLVHEGNLTKATEKVRAKYDRYLSLFPFLNETDLEAITILDFYDEEITIHSLETCLIAKEKIENKLSGVKLLDSLKESGVTGEEFFRACILHDIGKIEIPNFLINNSVDHSEMDEFLTDLIFEENHHPTLLKLEKHTNKELQINSELDLKNFLKKHNLRSVHFVPVSFITSESEQKIIIDNGFNLEDSLIDIIKTHEAYSETILRHLSFTVEANLAGAHHNYHGNGSLYHINIEELSAKFDLSELIRIADITEALSSNRTYKKPLPKLKICKIILNEAEVGNINETLAYIWINDDLEKITNNSITEDEKRDFEIVLSKIEAIKERNNLI